MDMDVDTFGDAVEEVVNYLMDNGIDTTKVIEIVVN